MRSPDTSPTIRYIVSWKSAGTFDSPGCHWRVIRIAWRPIVRAVDEVCGESPQTSESSSAPTIKPGPASADAAWKAAANTPIVAARSRRPRKELTSSHHRHDCPKLKRACLPAQMKPPDLLKNGAGPHRVGAG